MSATNVHYAIQYIFENTLMVTETRKNYRGFTIIELMIVVAIIGVLAAIAIPAYQRYTIRAQVAEGLSLFSPFKSAIAEYRDDNGSFPPNNTAAGLGLPGDYAGNYVSAISINDDVVSILFGNDANAAINGRILTITAVATLGSVSWNCTGGGVIADYYLPSACQ